MQKYHNLISFVIGLTYLIVLQVFSTPVPVFRFLAPAFLLYVGLVTWYNYKYLKSLNTYNFWVLLRPVLFFAASFGVFLLIPSAGLRGLYLVANIALIFLIEFALGNFAENILINETLIIAFALCNFFMGFSHDYFPKFNLLYLFGLFVSIALLARSFYEFIPHTPRVKIISAITISLFTVELFWVINFLPHHFSVLAFLLFSFFYFCLILNYYFLFQTLTIKKIQFHLSLILICSSLLLIITPWQVIG